MANGAAGLSLGKTSMQVREASMAACVSSASASRPSYTNEKAWVEEAPINPMSVSLEMSSPCAASWAYIYASDAGDVSDVCPSVSWEMTHLPHHERVVGRRQPRPRPGARVDLAARPPHARRVRGAVELRVAVVVVVYEVVLAVPNPGDCVDRALARPVRARRSVVVARVDERGSAEDQALLLRKALGRAVVRARDLWASSEARA